MNEKNIKYHIINDKVFDQETNLLIRNKFIRTVDNVYYVDSDGCIIKNKWILDKNNEYSYMDKEGKMIVNAFKNISGKTYYFNKQGYMIKDKSITINNVKYSFNKLGELI